MCNYLAQLSFNFASRNKNNKLMFQFIVEIDGRVERFWAGSERELRQDLEEFYPDSEIVF